MAEVAVPLLVGLAPVLGFLAALVLLESYKLVRLSTVVAVVASGAVVAEACYFANAWLMERLGLGVGVAFHEAPIHVRTGVAFIAVHDDVPGR